MTDLLLRTYADCASDAEAAEITRCIIQTAAPFGCEPSSTPAPYWKIKHLWGFTFRLYPPTRRTLDEIVALTNDGWVHSGGPTDPSAVWNRSRDCVFLTPQVAWASLDLIPDGAYDADTPRGQMN